ncbi:hypothetical protein PVAP13_9NG265900 [Panicum virgatum]|uniref:VWFA domain-containing protein n=1 Tax=Panicum virgatum TaxID=38727 RepID=A0A8T0MJS9_PANVG|nr:hypothetical protein PVAP13_9NG265900 [Panicum virgatum]
MEGEAAADPCAICLSDVGRGQAIFRAECSHVFHHLCISASVAAIRRPPPSARPSPSHGPVVRRPPPPPAMPSSSHGPYDDDEPVVVEPSVEAAQDVDPAADHAVVALRTHCERPALARGASRGSFEVLVHAVAPGAAAAGAPRTPLDLVTVIDLNGSMRGQKLCLVKQAVGFVIDNLGPTDRLSVVSFSNDANRVVRLARMTADGKASAKRAVEALVASGGTNIGEGLRMAARVLDDRRYRNTVTSVTSLILLSDGRDGHRRHRHADLVPPSFRGSGNRTAPIHTFGFGTDHDAAAMHTVAEETGGTFSFVENRAAIQDSFAQCIGGLLSVAMQSVRIAVACVHPGVRVLGVKSGRYKNRVDADRRAAWVDVGELYADEERRFLVFVRVPAAEAAEEVSQLIKVRCSYRDAVSGCSGCVAGDDAAVLRPPEVGDGDAELSMEVERERVRVAATEDIAAARAAAERGEHAEAARILEAGQEAVRRSAPGKGRAAMLAGMSSHRQQRDLSVALRSAHFGLRGGRGAGRGAPRPYETPAMRSMVKISRSAREQQQRTSSPAPPAKRAHLRFAE